MSTQSESNSNLVSMLADFVKKTPDKPVLFYKELVKGKLTDRILTYRDLDNKSSLFARHFSGLGLKAGDNVVVMVPVSSELYITLLGLFKIGCAAVIIEPGFGLKAMNNCCSLTEPKGFIGISKAFILTILSKTFRSIEVKSILGSSVIAPFTLKLNSIINSGVADYSIYNAGDDHDAIITFTSGSTGVPKGIRRTHGFLKTQMMVLSKELDFEKGDVEMTNLPVVVLNNMANGIATVLPYFKDYTLKSMDTKIIHSQIESCKVNRLTGSPFFVDKIFAKDDPVLKKIKKVFTGGGLVEGKTAINIGRYSEAVLKIIYGSTESEPIAVLRYENNDEMIDLGGVGKPVESIEVLVIKVTGGRLDFIKEDKDQLILPANKIGEIIVKGCHVNRGYYKNEDAVLENKIIDKNNGLYHRTGDTGYFDDTGRLWITGRVSNLVYSDNEPVDLNKIEKSLKKCLYIKKAAVVSFENNRVVVFVEKIQQCKNDVIISELESILKGMKIDPYCIRIIKRIPLDKRHNTKIDYKRLKKTI